MGDTDSMVAASSVQIAVLRGRDDECRAIRRLLGQLPGGGGALLLQGDPGSGRTALLRYAHRRARQCTILTAAGVVDEAAFPYAGLQRLLAPVRHRVKDLTDQRRRVLRRALAGDGCPPGDQLALAMAVLDLLAIAARERPLLCTMDDVDRGDRPTAEVLAFVARRVRQLPVVVLLTGAVGTTYGDLRTHRLPALSEWDSRAVLTDRLPNGLAEPVATALTAIAAGNPQALVDLAGALSPAQCRGDEPPPTAPPADGRLGRHYRARVDRLPADARRVLLIAALDEELEPATLVRAARAAGTAIEALAPAEEAGLVRVEPCRVWFPEPMARVMIMAIAPLTELRRAHLLLAGVLDGAGQRLRRAVHLAAATERPDAGLAAELAAAADGSDSHLAASAALHRAAELTAEPGLAAARLVSAAHRAWLAGQPHRARLLLRGVPDEVADPTVAGRAELLRGELELRCGRTTAALTALRTAADALAGPERVLALGALVGAGEAACFTGDHFRYAELARRARVLSRPEDGPGVELMTAYLGGMAATLRGDHGRAGPALRRAVILGRRLTGPALTPAALICAAAAGLLVARDGAAHQLADRAVELARARGELAVLPRALQLRANAEYWLGRHEAAADSSWEGLRVARTTGQTNWAGVHLGMLAVLSAIRGDRSASLRRVREIGADAASNSRPRALAQWALAVLDLIDGRQGDAAARLAALARPGTGRGQVLVQVMATPYLVEAATQPAYRPAAVAALTIFDRWADSTASPLRRALAARCRALLAARGSDAAEQGFRTALRLHPEGAGAFERARTELLFGRELRRGRRPRDARRHLQNARETFTWLGATTWADQAAAELRAAGESIGGPEPGATRALTGQQLRVAQLVAEGATNREIAARMFLSTRTVDHHLRNIFSRLGVRSRVELARALR